MKFKVLASIFISLLVIFFINSYMQYRNLQNQRFKTSLNLLGSSLLMYIDQYGTDEIEIDKLQKLIKEELGGTDNLQEYLEKEKSYIRFLKVPDSNKVIMYHSGPDKTDDSLRKSVYSYFELSYWQYLFSFKGDIMLSWIQYKSPCEKLLGRQWDEYYFKGERVSNETAFFNKSKILNRIEKSLFSSSSFIPGTYKKALIIKCDEEMKWSADIQCESPENFSEGNDLICSNFIDFYDKNQLVKQIDSAVINLTIIKK